MKTVFKPTFLILLLGVLQGCFYRGNYIGVDTISVAGEIVNDSVYNIRNPEKTDQLSSFGLTGGLNNGTESSFQLGAFGSWEKLNLGELYASASWYDMNKDLKGRYGDSSSSVLPIKIGLWFDVPVFKKKRLVHTVLYLVEDPKGDSLFYTKLGIENRRALSLRIGGGHFLSDFQTNAYAKSLATIFDSTIFEDNDHTGQTYIPQGNICGRIGISYSSLYSNSMDVNISQRHFKGARHSKFLVYADLLVNLATQIDTFNYRFQYYDPASPSYAEANFTFDPRTQFDKYILGVAFGLSYRLYTTPRSGLVFGCTIESGFSPGYYERPSQGIFSEFGLTLGFGSIKSSQT